MPISARRRNVKLPARYRDDDLSQLPELELRKSAAAASTPAQTPKATTAPSSSSTMAPLGESTPPAMVTRQTRRGRSAANRVKTTPPTLRSTKEDASEVGTVQKYPPAAFPTLEHPRPAVTASTGRPDHVDASAPSTGAPTAAWPSDKKWFARLIAADKKQIFWDEDRWINMRGKTMYWLADEYQRQAGQFAAGSRDDQRETRRKNEAFGQFMQQFEEWKGGSLTPADRLAFTQQFEVYWAKERGSKEGVATESGPKEGEAKEEQAKQREAKEGPRGSKGEFGFGSAAAMPAKEADVVKAGKGPFRDEAFAKLHEKFQNHLIQEIEEDLLEYPPDEPPPDARSGSFRYARNLLGIESAVYVRQLGEKLAKLRDVQAAMPTSEDFARVKKYVLARGWPLSMLEIWDFPDEEDTAK